VYQELAGDAGVGIKARYGVDRTELSGRQSSLETLITCQMCFLNMAKILVATSFVVIWSIMTILALLWGVRFDWPDYVHVNYGFPMVWGTHTLNTIAGPVDIWKVDLSSLLMDLVLWLGTMTAGAAVILYFSGPKRRAEKNQ